MPKPQDILGQKFGKLTVFSATDEKDADGRMLYLCRCDCGGERTAPAYLLLGGRVTSCGCARKGYIRSQEVESERVKQIYTQADGVYQRGRFWVAQMKFGGKTYHILSTPDKEEAIAARQEIVRLRTESGDDAGKFLNAYYDAKIYENDPFAKLDQTGVGMLMELAVSKAKATGKQLHYGICGEHGGDPMSVEFCHKVGLDYVSCSPFRVPIARLAAAQAAIKG